MAPMVSVNSRLCGGGKPHIWVGGVNLMHVFLFLCVFWVFFWENFGFGKGVNSTPKKIAGINTDRWSSIMD